MSGLVTLGVALTIALLLFEFWAWNYSYLAAPSTGQMSLHGNNLPAGPRGVSFCLDRPRLETGANGNYHNLQQNRRS